jgi:hypothetical protein
MWMAVGMAGTVLCLDIPAALMGLLSLISLWRAPLLLRYFIAAFTVRQYDINTVNVTMASESLCLLW